MKCTVYYIWIYALAYKYIDIAIHIVLDIRHISLMYSYSILYVTEWNRQETINVAWITIIIFIYTAPRPAVNRCIRKPERTCGIYYITQTLTTATLSAHIAQMHHGIEHTSGLPAVAVA